MNSEQISKIKTGILFLILLTGSICMSSPITREQLVDPNGAKVKFLSGIVSRNTPGHMINIEADIKGAKRLYLVVGDGGDDYSCDHVDWVEPRLAGPGGEKKLTDLKWSGTVCGWNHTVLNRSVAGSEMSIKGHKVAYGIGTHSVSVTEYKLPRGYTRFLAKGALDDTGTNQNRGSTVQFAVLTGKLSMKQLACLKLFDTSEITTVDTIEIPDAIIKNCPKEVVKEYLNTTEDIAGWGRYARFKKAFKTQVLNHQSLIFESDRDPADVVLRRTKALLEDLEKSGVDLEKEKQQLQSLSEKARTVKIKNSKGRFQLFSKLVKLRRKIAFSNPLLKGINRILFIKRDAMPDDESHGGHMCDQGFGHNSTNGGSTRDQYGLFVLDNPFSSKPTARNLLKNSVVEKGRLKGKKLIAGGYFSPDLSFDGKQILFAYSEGSLEKWKINSSFHIFKVNSDGSHLVQLTDGTKNDFDPCFLPNGRIVFISERRGGFGRCHGRPVPSYTLHSMLDDGTDIYCLSPHETNEWEPSVNNDGMIVYTRWDYVDRGFSQAHHPWLTTPDGRDPRAIHGNTRTHMNSEPFLEGEVRAVPGSRRYTATASAHHGEHKGSLILIDPDVKDDNAMAPVKRITPEQLFPEAETRYHKRGAYATAWPLSEYYYFCVYDHYANGSFKHFRYDKTNYGIYLLDAFGNKELLYRDEKVSCLSPIPLRPRRKPPVISNGTLVVKARDDNGRKPKIIDPGKLPGFATIGLVNVYNSRYRIPKGEKIKTLRIFQLLPKTTFAASRPRIGYGDQKGAKNFLGTVPVEKDGSAFFKAPVGKPILFQAVASDGTAIQSMRSATYVKPGEALVCLGCHESRTSTPRIRPVEASAFLRRPSTIKPGPAGSNPFSFARLVQPVLDRKCVACHEKNKNKNAPDLSRGDYLNHRDYWFTSYGNLRKYCFYYNSASFTAASTIPGEFGARASALYKMLKKGHYAVKLTNDEWERIIVWLDGNCNFFGSDDDIKSQAEGKIVHASLE